MPPYEASEMPLRFFLKFFQNHGLFKLKNRPQWFTVSNRSKTYVNKILSKISGEYYKNYKIHKIKRLSSGVQIHYGEKNEFFDYDKVVVATHANDALSILDDPLEKEKEILSKFNYKENIAVVHTDERIMPKNKKVWSSWNSHVKPNNPEINSLTYWLNLLQNLKCKENIFLTLNPISEISENKIIKKVNFTHPYLNSENTALQKDLRLIQGKKRTWFCGSYFGYGFHEDGLKSSIDLINNFKI